MKRVFVLACVAVAGSSQALLIDDFSSGSVGQSIQAGTWVGSQAGTMIGGERDSGLVVVSNPLNTFLDLSINGGLNVTSAGTLLDGAMGLDYDGVGDETDSAVPFEDGPGLGSLNLAASADRFRINFLANDLPLVLTISVYTFDTNQFSFSQQVVAGGTSGDVDVMFSSFTGGASFNDIDRMVFSFEMSPSGDFAINTIEAVPEPTSMAVLGLGLAAVARKRRARK